jgi:signal transduction histidine kinase
MTDKKKLLKNRWMLTPVEIAGIVLFILLTISGVVVSVQDALQLRRALDLNLTQTIILNQGIVNLQREVQLTHKEVLRLLGNLDNPPKPITRFDFVKIQVNNLVTQVESQTRTYAFPETDLAIVHEIEGETAVIDRMIASLDESNSPTLQAVTLKSLDSQLDGLESSIKQLVDRQATLQREEIIQTRDSLTASQRTDVIVGIVVTILSFALANLFRRTLTSRLQQVVESDRLKGQLLANVSHELRTPINAIQGYSQLMSEGAYGDLSDKQKTTVQRVLINTTQLKGMVDNLLDRAQMEQGKLTLRKEPFVPADLIESTHSALNILASTKNLELTSEITPDVPTALNGDMLRLQQILFNLVSNAIKFTEKGSVHIRISLPDKEHWALQVTDTGIGITPEKQTQVFAPFWQVDSSATRHYRGSGLGLSIVKQLSELMGGSVSLTSQPEKGSTFTIIFPLETQK